MITFQVKPLRWAKCKGYIGDNLRAWDAFGNEFARMELASTDDADVERFKLKTQEAYESVIRSIVVIGTQQGEGDEGNI